MPCSGGADCWVHGVHGVHDAYHINCRALLCFVFLQVGNINQMLKDYESGLFAVRLLKLAQ